MPNWGESFMEELDKKRGKEMTLEDLKDTCTVYLELIAKNFTPDCKITLVVRKPSNDEADFVLSNDDREEVVKAVRRRL